MSSILFSVGNFFLIEYDYNETIYASGDVGFRKVENLYDSIATFVNDNNASNDTRNTVDDTIVKLDDGRWALLDNDTAFFYPNVDSNINISDITIAPPLNVTYNRVRVHIVSGYNFPDHDGFHLSLGLKKNDGTMLKILSHGYLKSDNKNLFFNPKPIRTTNFIYDRYIEFYIPSTDWITGEQFNNPSSTSTLSYYFTDGVGIQESRSIYAEFAYIRNTSEEQGSAYLLLDNFETFVFSAVDDYANLLPTIEKATDGDYFRYHVIWGSESMEDFIFRLNGQAGNDWVVIHDIRVLEQVNSSFSETIAFTDIQDNNFGDIKRFRPVLRFADTAISFSIDYTVRLYNRADGRSVFKFASLNVTDVGLYGKSALKLNVGQDIGLQKVYNKLVDNEGVQFNQLEKIVTTKIVAPTLVDTSDVYIQTEDESLNYKKDFVPIRLKKFDNLFKFIVRNFINNENEFLDLSSSEYFMIFSNDEGEEIRIIEYTNAQYSKLNGELVFKVTKEKAKEIKKLKDNTYAITSINVLNEETVLFEGKINPTSADLINEQQIVQQNQLINVIDSLNKELSSLKTQMSIDDSKLANDSSVSNVAFIAPSEEEVTGTVVVEKIENKNSSEKLVGKILKLRNKTVARRKKQLVDNKNNLQGKKKNKQNNKKFKDN